jgi:NAD+ kinase
MAKAREKAQSKQRTSQEALGILFKANDLKSLKDVRQITQILHRHLPKAQILLENNTTPSKRWSHSKVNWMKPDAIVREVDRLLVVGGDGSILRASRLLLQTDQWDHCRILGIHSGTVGFLAALNMSDALAHLPSLLKNKSALSEEVRSCLQVKIERKGKIIRSFHVLNDCVLSKGSLSRIFEFHVQVNGEFLSSYRADGLIVSPPTGSTAYNLAAGGAIVHHDIPAIQITPISPQSLSNKPIILSDQHEITLKLGRHSTNVYLTMDGQKGLKMGDDDIVHILKSEKSVRFLSVKNNELSHYFESLRQKLNWGLVPKART